MKKSDLLFLLGAFFFQKDAIFLFKIADEVYFKYLCQQIGVMSTYLYHRCIFHPTSSLNVI